MSYLKFEDGRAGLFGRCDRCPTTDWLTKLDGEEVCVDCLQREDERLSEICDDGASAFGVP